MNRKKCFWFMSAALVVIIALSFGIAQSTAAVAPPPLVPGVDYTIPNYNLSPIMRKFVDSLPGLTAAGVAVPGFWPAGANTLGNSIPVAVPMAVLPAGVPSGGDYYEIAVVEYTQQMHADMPATLLRGYVQIEPPGAAQPAGSLHVKLMYPDGVTPLLYNNVQVYGYDKPRYLGPVIVATQNRPTRVKFYNLLPTMAKGGDLFLPTDTTIMGAGMGPDGMTSYTRNRATLHLHGGDNPWISDGTANQWITPPGEVGILKGASQSNVPDMPLPTGGTATFFWPNGQSGRLMFYHDHALGMTRSDVYGGEAAGFLLTDDTVAHPNPNNERALNSFAPGGEIPLVIQDKSFVNNNNPLPAGYANSSYNTSFNTFALDPLWSSFANADAGAWGQTSGSLWFPHIYMPNQNPNDPSGSNPMGRWDYGAWFWPMFPVVANLPLTSAVPETFVDTPVINGQAYPYLNVNPTTYRFRILDASNDRYLNLQLYVATNIVSGVTVTGGGAGYTSAPSVTFTNAPGDTTGHGASAMATVDLNPANAATFGKVTGITMTSVGSGYNLTPLVTISSPASGVTATASANFFTSLTPAIKPSEVGMVPASKSFPAAWPLSWVVNDTPGLTPNVLDGRPGGVPDPLNIGPSFIHIGTEGGLSPHAVELPNTPVGYEQNKRSVTVLNILEHTLYLGPAERADVMVDFSAYAGKTLILYNDAPAPNPGEDSRNTYYTAGTDNTFQGGAPPTQAGFGPNSRTIMQINVAGTAPAASLVVANLDTAVNAAYNATQPPPIVTQNAYLPAGSPVGPDVYSRISDTSIVPNGAPAAVGAVFIATGGTGYKSVPKVVFTGGNPATPATAYATLTNGVVTGLALTSGGSGYTSTPSVQFVGGTPTTAAEAVADLAGSVPFGPKSIQELFDPLGRMNATMGVEIPRTSATVQTTIPYGFIDPITELFADGDTQLWKITQNGVDAHAIHFHLFNVQVLNRVGWDGAIKPPWPEEIGWKDTVKMNPLEDIVVAFRAKKPTVPAAFGALPDSVRMLNVAMPVGDTTDFTGVDPNGNPVAVANQLANFGNEYTWHCHLLGHEENDMMRPTSLAVAPPAPSGLKATVNAQKNVVLTWTNNIPPLVANNYMGVTIQRASDAAFTTQVLNFNLGKVTTYTDKAFSAAGTYYYRVASTDTVGSGVAGYPSLTAVSSYTPTPAVKVVAGHAGVPTAAVSLNAVYQTAALTPVVLNWSVTAGGGQTGFRVQRATNAAFTAGLVNYNIGNVLTYSNTTAKAGTTYYYRVVPTDATGAGTASNVVSISAF